MTQPARSFVYDPEAAAISRRGPGIGPQTQRVLDYIRACKDFPRAGEIALHMGWRNATSVYDCLYRLQARGLIERDTGRPAKWRLVT